MLLHVGVALAITAVPSFANIYTAGALLYFLVTIFQTGNNNNQALLAAAYFTAAEVFLRMTTSNWVPYEFGKYTVIGLLLIGLFYKGASSKSGPYWIYLFLLAPGIFFASIYLDPGTDVRRVVTFNLSGPVALGLCAIYCYRRSISRARLQHILLAMMLPVVTLAVYLYFNTPDIQDVLGSTSSNFAASGGFGPNQVSTALGIGMFVLLTRLFVISDRVINLIDLSLLALISYRALVTFSRGGVITGIACAIAFIVIYFMKGNLRTKAILIPKISVVVGLMVVTFIFTAVQTSGLITNRYTNKDAAGRLKSDITTGRAELITSELEAFYEKPLTGIGVGKIRQYRYEKTKVLAATHNEFSRLISEHGILGVFALSILLLTPLFYRFKNDRNHYFYAFLLFWGMTIGHSSMRIAAPAFIYGLCLLNVIYEKPAVHRKQAVETR